MGWWFPPAAPAPATLLFAAIQLAACIIGDRTRFLAAFFLTPFFLMPTFTVRGWLRGLLLLGGGDPWVGVERTQGLDGLVALFQLEALQPLVVGGWGNIHDGLP